MPPGFNIRRWIYWLTRLEQVTLSARNSGEEELAIFSTGVMDNMIIAVEETGGQLKKDLSTAYENGLLKHRPFVHHFPPE